MFTNWLIKSINITKELTKNLINTHNNFFTIIIIIVLFIIMIIMLYICYGIGRISMVSKRQSVWGWSLARLTPSHHRVVAIFWTIRFPQLTGHLPHRLRIFGPRPQPLQPLSNRYRISSCCGCDWDKGSGTAASIATACVVEGAARSGIDWTATGLPVEWVAWQTAQTVMMSLRRTISAVEGVLVAGWRVVVTVVSRPFAVDGRPPLVVSCWYLCCHHRHYCCCRYCWLLSVMGGPRPDFSQTCCLDVVYGDGDDDDDGGDVCVHHRPRWLTSPCDP